jgi:hypothetical protein
MVKQWVKRESHGSMKKRKTSKNGEGVVTDTVF